MKILKILVLTALSTNVFAHVGHDHGTEPAQLVKSPPSADHPSVSGRLFEVVMERCETDEVHLYVAETQTNQPLSEAQIEVVASGDITLTAKAEASKSAGVYLLPVKAKEGDKVTLELKISTPKMSETLTLTVAKWSKPSEKCTH